jgi:hypothetical protein
MLLVRGEKHSFVEASSERWDFHAQKTMQALESTRAWSRSLDQSNCFFLEIKAHLLPAPQKWVRLRTHTSGCCCYTFRKSVTPKPVFNKPGKLLPGDGDSHNLGSLLLASQASNF